MAVGSETTRPPPGGTEAAGLESDALAQAAALVSVCGIDRQHSQPDCRNPQGFLHALALPHVEGSAAVVTFAAACWEKRRPVMQSLAACIDG
ncbi:MAG: hypothetical protein OXH52_22220 [Gammaproteobacteria bacterium]|nr:hypothetical protein [Gammaproteobacteria bacterium]